MCVNSNTGQQHHTGTRNNCIRDPALRIGRATTAGRSSYFKHKPVGTTKVYIHWVPGSLQVVDLPGREAVNSLPSRAEVKNEWSYNAASNRRLHDVDKGTFAF